MFLILLLIMDGSRESWGSGGVTHKLQEEVKRRLCARECAITDLEEYRPISFNFRSKFSVIF